MFIIKICQTLVFKKNRGEAWEKLNKITKVYLSGSGPCLFVVSPTNEEKKAIEEACDDETKIFAIHLL